MILSLAFCFFSPGPATDFEGHLPPCGRMHSEIDPGKPTLSKYFDPTILRHVERWQQLGARVRLLLSFCADLSPRD